ncbi:hypothetical protein [Pseudonocardia sp. WMMC193]|uniref:hypothetical protein n=1 Tax=Pseudonocardia sp. WMMC193 TaxID=2911965 RepID=UPI001F290389|nr:hypothetical protein [Pseudonocardia sp. WMMC193]MCF7550291.1 hypothetical protein [Pseudonocardia sp. WMMC193]
MSVRTSHPALVLPPRVDPVAVAALLRSQHGAVASGQLHELGMTRSAITAQVEAGRWRWWLPRVYVVGTTAPRRATRIAAALLYGGPPAVLSHRTAAEEWAMVRREPGPVHLTVPYGASAVSQVDRVVVHRSRAMDHIVVPTEPRRTARADTAVDLAVEEPDARAARRLLISLMTGGRLRPVDVEIRLAERSPRRYRRALRSAVQAVREGVHSALEDLYVVEVEQAHGLPTGGRQIPVSVDGVVLWEDVTYDRTRLPLTVRLDGRTHLQAGRAFRDRRRDNAAELAGRSRLVFGWDETNADPCGVAQEVASVMRRLGWGGSPRPCPRCPS